MSSVLTPIKTDALGLAFVGVDVQDPDGVQTLDRVCGAATFGKPVQDELLALIDLVYHGTTKVFITNFTGSTLAAGALVRLITTVNVSGVEQYYPAALASASSVAAEWVVPVAILDQEAGYAVSAGAITTTLNTTGAAVGDYVFLSTAGAPTLTDPSIADPSCVRQIVGVVSTISATGRIRYVIQKPAKYGSAFIQTSGISSANLSADAILAAEVFA